VGQYTLERIIGQGGFAWVFAAKRPAEGLAALKVLKPRYAGDRQFESRFRNESRVASELTHRNIVRILDIGQVDDITYFAMDLYPDSLRSRIDRDGPLPEAELVKIAMDVAAALSFAHANGVIHRDIKVDNILFEKDGTAVVTDFGIMRAVSGYVSDTGVNMTIGTPSYMSPEQAQGRQLDGRSDLYALGLTLYKGATGELPFKSTDWFELARMHVEDAPAPPRSRRPELSRRFELVILKCLAKHPDDRYASADAFLGELQSIRDQARKTETFGQVDPRLQQAAMEAARAAGRPRTTGIWVIVITVAVVVITTLVVILARR
jgi:serine/threonine protein kinase